MQSRKPLAHAPIPHAPAAQVADAFVGTGHAVPHVPQLVVSVERSWQLEPQHVSAGLTQGWVGEHPCAHAFCTQICPAEQSESPTHSTQAFLDVSHFGVVPLQSVASLQPAAH